MRRFFEIAAVLVVSFAYFSLFRGYGFQLEDEGTLLFHLDRAARGLLPYTDFHTGYTPGFFAVGSWLLRTVDYQVELVRLALAVLNAVTVAGIFAVARRIVPAGAAVVPAVTWVVLLPVFAGSFASFNVPYPAWLATTAWMMVAALVLVWVRRPRILTMLAVGMAAAAAFAVKPNAGAFAMAGAVWAISPFLDLSRSIDRYVQRAASVTMALGVWTAFGFAVIGWDVLIFLFPALAVAAVAGGLGAGKHAVEDGPGSLPTFFALGVGFVIPTSFWVVPTLARLGLHGFATDVLLFGSGAAALYHSDHPRPEFFAIVITAAVVGFVAVSALLRRQVVSLRTVAVGAALPVVIGGWRLASSSMALEGFEQSLITQLHNAAMLLAPIVHVAAIGFVWNRSGNAGTIDSHSERALIAIVPLSAAMYLQVWPRIDFTHFVWSAPLLLVLATGLSLRVGEWWEDIRLFGGVRARPILAAGVVGLLAVLAIAQLSLVIPAVVRARSAQPAVATTRLTYSIEEETADDHRALGMTLAWLGERAVEGEPVISFPGMSGVLFALGLVNPLPHDYWYPGRPNHGDEAQMLATLRAAPPRFAVTLHRRWAFFTDSAFYFRDARRFARDNYRLAARFGRFDLLVRRDQPEEPVLSWQPTGPLEAMFKPALLARQQATERWTAGVSPAQARKAVLPTDRREARLLLRAIRDGPDMRAASWLVVGSQSSDPVLRREAESAMLLCAFAFDGARYTWANRFRPSDLTPWLEHLRPWASQVSDSSSSGVRWFAGSILFALDGSPEPERPAEFALRATDAF
ncbi:MAG: hypothetical protein ACI91F_001981 [Candidatus Binatia bacterium]|jgi:hypothetical protein